ncbi:MAG TPA: histidine ammonia-lyase, partial [Ignavibacteria bacterium]|nr:histidine ammonia-lyase [Ignavibacteria bacterium]
MYIINGNNLNIHKVFEIILNNEKISLSTESIRNIKKSRDLVNKWVKEDKVIYGITTGFGEFKDVKISSSEIKTLQKNLIISHSTGVGKYIPDVIVRCMLLLRINSLANGFSGVRIELLNKLIEIFNKNIIPLIPSQGSVGSSGDLAPLSHLAMCILGLGNAKDGNLKDGKIYSVKSLFKKYKINPIELEAKEGLALINGTQYMNSFLAKCVHDSYILSKLFDVSAVMSLEALRGTDKAFDKKIQDIRPHKGQISSAYNFRKLIKGSKILISHKNCGKVQDAYSLRCMPQVHGAVKDTLNYVKNITEIEMNSVTDNPLIFAEDNIHLEGGNFHGEPLALAADFLAIAMSELGNISERRIARLVDGNLSGLPRFLTKNGGLNSGLMIAQYTAAALVSENKVLCHPASVDSIPTSANQEDHNSMGSVSAKKCYDVINNLKNIVAIEFLCASQGLDFLSPLKSGKGIQKAFDIIRNNLPHISDDVIVSDYISELKKIIFDNS